MRCLTDAAAFILVGLQLTRAAPASIRGPSSLLGFSESNGVNNENTDDFNHPLADGQGTTNANVGQFLDFSDIADPQPIRGTKGGTQPGSDNDILNKLYPDKVAPPGTDHGGTINAQWSLSKYPHHKLGLNRAGFSRQENTVVMPDATAFAGVQMRLEEGAYRELHWHVASEWALMLNGSARIQAINENGEAFLDDVSKGDVWFFPPGVPHSIQGLGGGTEFLLVFDDGEFSEDNTFLVSEIFAHNPKSVLSQNLGVPISAFDGIPPGELFIFPGTAAPSDIEKQNVTNSNGVIPKSATYSYHFSKQEPLDVAGGSVKIIDPQSFPIADMVSAALVTVAPGAMREIHWHPTSDEWTFFLYGQGRATLFTAEDSANTFDFSSGDVGYFPQSNSHYVQNTGDVDLVLLEVLKADHFSDIALGQWIATTPPQIVEDTLNLSSATVKALSKAKEKQYVIPSSGPVANPIKSS
ncbi:Bicupin, oxalate decarboxylase/oxidase [Rhizodiscina lignyota]|uniref:Bicupin, oxalate decarboxylase/oxidase n=1 Tax=Rhizodiscina lignyota TaxID=1504668 RepID=A0A9P4M2J2_9PEZI|nr:Bicupin, oxalate decarboxylase/oxidase [Rhizodiscina lignyota]